MFSPSQTYSFKECPFIQAALIGKDPGAYQNIILICEGNSTDGMGENSTYFVLLNQSSKGVFQVATKDPLTMKFKIQHKSQPFFLDLNGDLRNEIVYNDESGNVKVGVFNADMTEMKPLDFYSTFVLSSTDDSSCLDPAPTDSLSIPHSSAYLDLDGDCLADIFMTKQRDNSDSPELSPYYYEIYI